MTREQARREIDSLDFYLQNHTDDYGEESHTAMMMAKDALSCSEKPNKWIPVSERLPEPYQRCLFTVKKTRWENEPVEYIVIVKAYGGEQDFTAWMPLPEPYKGESEEKDADCD